MGICSITSVSLLTLDLSPADPPPLSQPFLSIVLFALAGTVGLITHHLLPQLRKHHPWMWVSHPVLRSREYQQREATGQCHGPERDNTAGAHVPRRVCKAP